MSCTRCEIHLAAGQMTLMFCWRSAFGCRIICDNSSRVAKAIHMRRDEKGEHWRLSHPVLALQLPSPPLHSIFKVSSMASSSSSNFQSIFTASLRAYENKTKNKLLDHPLAASLQSCDSPNAVLSVLQDLIQQFDQRRTSDERLKNWLNPTVNVLYTFSATLGEGVGLVSLSSLSLYNLYSDCHLLDIPSRKSDICRYRCPSLGECP